MLGRRPELALIPVYELYTFDTEDLPYARLLPGRGAQRVFVQKIAASINLLLIEAGYEVEV